MRHTHQTDEEQVRYADPAHDEYLAHMDEIALVAAEEAERARKRVEAEDAVSDCAAEGMGTLRLLLAEEEPSRCVNCWKLKPTVRGVCASCTRDLNAIGRRSA